MALEHTLRVKEIAEALGISCATVRRMALAGDFRYSRIGKSRQMRIWANSYVEYLKRNTPGEDMNTVFRTLLKEAKNA